MDRARFFFVGDSLDDIEAFEQDLEAIGIAATQTHFLSKNATRIDQHKHLNPVNSFMKRDVVHSTVIGVFVGLFFAAAILVLAMLAGWNNTSVGWMPFLFLAIVTLGFATWMGGLYGIQTPNHQFARFEEDLNNGKHVLFVDTSYAHEAALNSVLAKNENISKSGVGAATPSWLIWLRKKTDHLWYWKVWRYS